MYLWSALFAVLTCTVPPSVEFSPLLLTLLSCTLPGSAAASSPVAIPASAEDSPIIDTSRPSTTRMTWQQRFIYANSSGDGRLTLIEARSGYPAVARRFAEIDATGKGYVTQDDIRAWHKMLREARLQARAIATDPLRPRTAYQWVFPEQRPASVSPVLGTPRVGQPATMMVAPTEELDGR